MKIRKKLIRLLSTTCLKIAIKFTEDDKRENLNRILCEVIIISEPCAQFGALANDLLGLWLPVLEARRESYGAVHFGEVRMVHP